MNKQKVLCRLCGREIESDAEIFTIPLDANWDWTDGTYCSRECAFKANRSTFSVMRSAAGNNTENQEKWMKEQTSVIPEIKKK
jgi:hypothetical protein